MQAPNSFWLHNLGECVISVIIIDPHRLRTMLDAAVAASTAGSLSGDQLSCCQDAIDALAQELKEVLSSADPPIMIEPAP